MAIYRGAGGSGDAVNDASSEVLLAVEAKNAAITAQLAAEAAKTAAELAETNAETAETNAETAETNAEAARDASINMAENFDVTVSTLSAGSSATASYNNDTFVLALGIPRGNTGATGATGATGSAGTNGTDGAAATISVGTTTTGSAGTSASVTNSGSSSAAVFNFTIPRGDTGATGATGATGSTGATGAKGDTGAGVVAGGTAGQVLAKINGTDYNTQWITPNAGTVTSVTGTSPVVSSGGATPAISLAANYGDTQNPYASKTANNFLAAPNGSSGAPTFRAIAAADIPTLNQNTTGTAANVTGTVAIANGGTGATTLAGANIPVTNVANSFTGLQTFAGTSSNADLKTSNIVETVTVSATAATGTINYDITTQSVLYYTTNASGNFTVNFRGSSGTSLNTIMSTGESMSATFLVTNGATAYYNSAVQVDGSSVTPKWQGGTAPTSGNVSSIDVYSYVIIKTGSAAFTVLASVTKFA